MTIDHQSTPRLSTIMVLLKGLLKDDQPVSIINEHINIIMATLEELDKMKPIDLSPESAQKIVSLAKSTKKTDWIILVFELLELISINQSDFKIEDFVIESCSNMNYNPKDLLSANVPLITTYIICIDSGKRFSLKDIPNNVDPFQYIIKNNLCNTTLEKFLAKELYQSLKMNQELTTTRERFTKFKKSGKCGLYDIYE